MGKAEATLRIVTKRSRSKLGVAHPDTLASIHQLGTLLLKTRKEKPREAERLLREALAGRRSVLGKDHPDTRASMKTLAELLELRLARKKERVVVNQICADMSGMAL